MKFLSGSHKETRYEKPKGVGPPVKEDSCTVLKTDDVAYIYGTFIKVPLALHTKAMCQPFFTSL